MLTAQATARQTLGVYKGAQLIFCFLGCINVYYLVFSFQTTRQWHPVIYHRACLPSQLFPTDYVSIIYRDSCKPILAKRRFLSGFGL
jgi:hypothetical protein